MLPDPLHPAVVHLPLAIAALLPFAVLWALLAVKRAEGSARGAWLPVAALAVLFTVVSWAAEETGEDEEDRVEAIVGHDLVHEHEEMAEQLKYAGWVAGVVALAGLFAGRVGAIARGLTLLLSLVVLGLGLRVGHSGGEIVHGPDGLASQAQPAAAEN